MESSFSTSPHLSTLVFLREASCCDGAAVRATCWARYASCVVCYVLPSPRAARGTGRRRTYLAREHGGAWRRLPGGRCSPVWAETHRLAQRGANVRFGLRSWRFGRGLVLERRERPLHVTFTWAGRVSRTGHHPLPELALQNSHVYIVSRHPTAAPIAHRPIHSRKPNPDQHAAPATSTSRRA